MSEPANQANDKPLKLRITELADRVKNLSRATLIVFATTAVGVLLLGGWLLHRANSEEYVVMFSGLSQDDAAALAQKLKEQKAPYRVVDGGVIEVPASRVHDLRLEAASAGLPRGGGVGFESFDKMRLGATDFEQRVMLRRAMEGELVRTISSVSAIESARVHLVLPEKSVFVQKRDPGSASVVVKLRPGRELGPQEIASIVHLVSSAVPGLVADRVALATTEGKLLRKPRPAGEGDGVDVSGDEPTAMTRNLETHLEERARAIVERAVGPGHADVRVSAEMDFSKIERTEDRFKPRNSILRSEELMVERLGPGDVETLAGVPGAESNLPTGDGEESEVAAGGVGPVLRHQHTRNFEMDRVTEKRTSRVGQIKRLSVAVVVNGTPMVDEAGNTYFIPREQYELDRITQLVSSAVGADERRDDLVTVDCFVSEPVAAAASVIPPAEVGLAALVGPEKSAILRKYLPHGIGALALFGVLSTLLIARKVRKSVSARRAEQLLLTQSGQVSVKTVDALEEPDPVLLLNPREEALRRATEDPATAALVIRHWLGSAGEEQAPADAA